MTSQGNLFLIRTAMIVLLALLVFQAIPVTGLETPVDAGLERSLFCYREAFSFSQPIFEDNPYIETQDVTIQGLDKYAVPGEPEIPSASLSIALPPGAVVEEITVMPTAASQTIPQIILTPGIEFAAVSSTYEAFYGDQSDIASYYSFSDIYSSSGLYPKNLIEHRTSFGLVRDSCQEKKVVLTDAYRAPHLEITVFPIQFDPMDSSVMFYPEMELEVLYSCEPETSTRAGEEELLIITTEDQIPAYQKLADYRNLTGMPTRIVDVEAIYRMDYFTIVGRDLPEMIKSFIRTAVEQWGITHVILAGDSEQVPIRHIYIQDIDGWNTPSDLYYADLYKDTGAFADWQADLDSRWGEFGDDMVDIDLRPDIHIGRLPSANINDAMIMVEKVIDYELNSYGSAWFKNITLMGLDTFNEQSGIAEGEYFCDYLADNYYLEENGWKHNKLYASLGNCNRANFNTNQSERVGFMAFSDHGLEQGWGGKVNTNDVANMKNGQMLPIVTVDACLCGAFDDNEDCFAESFLKSYNGGGASVFASSRISYGSWGKNHVNHVSGFLNRMFHESYAVEGVGSVGGMYQYTMSQYLSRKNPRMDEITYKCMVEYVLFADPCTKIGGTSTTLEIELDPLEKTIDPGKSVDYEIVLKNTGDGATVIDIYSDLPEGLDHKVNWTCDLVVNHIYLSPGEERVVKAVINCPGSAVAETVQEAGLTIYAPNVASKYTRFKTITTVNTIYTFNFTASEDKITLEPGEETPIKVWLENTGNKPFIYTLTPEHPAGWRTYLENDIVELEQNEGIWLDYHIACDAWALSGKNDVGLRCTILEKPDENTTLDMEIFVNRTSGFEMSSINGSKIELEPGEKGSFELEINNLGNDKDTIDLELDPEALPGWKLSYDPGNVLQIPAFSSQMLKITAQAPVEIEAGPVSVPLSARLMSDDSEINTTLSAVILPVSDIELVSNAYFRTLKNPDATIFNITIRNRGNTREEFLLNALIDDPGLKGSLPSTFIVDPYSERSFDLRIEAADPFMEAGNYEIGINAVSQRNSIQEQITIMINIEELPGVSITSDETKQIMDPGDQVKFDLKISNLGNTKDTYQLSVNSNTGLKSSLSIERVQIEPFTDLEISFDVSSYDDAGSGVYEYTIEVESLGFSKTKDTLLTEVVVKQFHGLILEAGQRTIEIDDDRTIDYQYTITNTGNGRDIYEISVLNIPEDWSIESKDLIAVDPGKSFSGNFTILLPEELEEKDSFDLILQVTCREEAELEDTALITLETQEEESEKSGLSLDPEFTTIGLGILVVVLILVFGVVMLKKPKN